MDVLRRLGITPAGGSHYYISQRIKREGLDTSHFLGSRANRGDDHKGGPDRLSAETILVNGRLSRRESVLKLRRALDEIGRPRSCDECGMGEEWNGKFLVLHIDHINGDNVDNRAENLRYLCPNCHSQTGTYCRAKTPR